GRRAVLPRAHPARDTHRSRCPWCCHPRRRAASLLRDGTPSRAPARRSRARRAPPPPGRAAPGGRVLPGFRAIVSWSPYAIGRGGGRATWESPLFLLPGHRRGRESGPRQGRQAEVRAGAVQGIVDVAMDVLLAEDRKSTRLNSSHLVISYAVFCLKK